jgi:hypothetical protein
MSRQVGWSCAGADEMLKSSSSSSAHDLLAPAAGINFSASILNWMSFPLPLELLAHVLVHSTSDCLLQILQLQLELFTIAQRDADVLEDVEPVPRMSQEAKD